MFALTLLKNAKISCIKKGNALKDRRTNLKVYWTVLKNFLNNIKVPSVAPNFLSGETIANIVGKTNNFNEFSQCTHLENINKLPLLLMNTDKRLNTVLSKNSDITSIIKFVNSTKPRGFDNILILMIQLCRDCMTLRPPQMFESSLSQGALAITSAIQGTSRESLYKEFELESLQSRRLKNRKTIFFYKILNGLTPKYLNNVIPVSNDRCYNTRAQSKSELKSEFFPY